MCGSMSRGTRQDKSGDLSSVSHAYSFRHIDERGTQHVVWGGGLGIGASSYDVDTGFRGRGSERVNDGALRPVGQLEENVSRVVKRSAPGTVSNERNDAAKSSGPGSGSTASFGGDSRGSVDPLDSGVRAASSHTQHVSPLSSHSLRAADVMPTDTRVSTFPPSINAAGPWVVPIRGDLDEIAWLMAGDLYIGRGSRQRGLLASTFSNPYKVGE